MKCPDCGLPMERKPELDHPIHWGEEPHLEEDCPHDEGMMEAYVCPKGHIDWDAFD